MTGRMLPLFHHAFPIADLAETERFYGAVLGCPVGRRHQGDAVNVDFFGHHVIAHLVDGEEARLHASASAGGRAAIRHFGVVLAWRPWEELAERLRGEHVAFLVEPVVRHSGEEGEEALMMLRDPSGNAIEFKAFRDVERLFGAAR